MAMDVALACFLEHSESQGLARSMLEQQRCFVMDAQGSFAAKQNKWAPPIGQANWTRLGASGGKSCD